MSQRQLTQILASGVRTRPREHPAQTTQCMQGRTIVSAGAVRHITHNPPVPSSLARGETLEGGRASRGGVARRNGARFLAAGAPLTSGPRSAFGAAARSAGADRLDPVTFPPSFPSAAE
jgi:hypothetical protein